MDQICKRRMKDPDQLTLVTPELAVDTVDVARLPWVFSQSYPLDTAKFCKESERRGLRLDLPTLRELYRLGLVTPFLLVKDRRVQDGRPPIESLAEPDARGTLLIELRLARDRGRLADPAKEPFRPRLRFERRSGDSRGWWNGLIYSTYQLLAVTHFSRYIEGRIYSGSTERPRVRLRPPGPLGEPIAARLRNIAIVLTALEARYLPKLDTDFIHLTNADIGEWEQYRHNFDPAATATHLGCPPKQVLADAEWLLMRAKHLDPMGHWSKLVCRARPQSWKSLTGDALAAMDYRIAAEILLLFYEDLAKHGAVAPLQPLPPHMWHSRHERLSYRHKTLDETLASLGVSPHPRVVVVVEGETEEYIVARMRKRFETHHGPDLVQVVVARSTTRDLTKLTAFATAPLLGQRRGSDWDLIKPLTRLVILFDPDRGFATPDEVKEKRNNILKEILLVVQAQGADPDPVDLNDLVHIHTWDESCFEFTHFTDEELAGALRRLHPNCSGMNDAQLERALALHRANRLDIGKVWNKWRPDISKVGLARELWPLLEAKIVAAIANRNAALPPIAERFAEVYGLARSQPTGTFVLRDRAVT